MKQNETSRQPYEAPRVIAREDLKEITLYTGFDASENNRRRSRKLIWDMP